MVEDRPIQSVTEILSDISFMAIFAEVTVYERIIYRHLRGIHPLLDYDASETQSMISI